MEIRKSKKPICLGAGDSLKTFKDGLFLRHNRSKQWCCRKDNSRIPSSLETIWTNTPHLKECRHKGSESQKACSFVWEEKGKFSFGIEDSVWHQRQRCLENHHHNKKLLPADKEEDQNLHLLLLLSPLLSLPSLAADSTVYHSIATKIHQLVHCSLNLFRWIFIPFCWDHGKLFLKTLFSDCGCWCWLSDISHAQLL